MGERIRRRKRADKMKERQVKARIRARNKAAQRGQALRETLLRTHISSPPRSLRSVRCAAFVTSQRRNRGGSTFGEKRKRQARILRRDVERRRKARERMARVPPILSMMEDLDLGRGLLLSPRLQQDHSIFKRRWTGCIDCTRARTVGERRGGLGRRKKRRLP